MLGGFPIDILLTHARTRTAAYTGPLEPRSAGNWTVLLRGSPTTSTRPVNLTAADSSGVPPPCINTTCKGRLPGVSSPALFAVRDYGKGRVAILNQWRQYTTGSGSHWFFDRQITERGVGNRSSDMGRLLRNCLRWLATAPSSSGIGGFLTPPGRWASPNADPAVPQQFQILDTSASGLGNQYLPHALDGSQCLGCSADEKDGKMFRGLIGARTGLSDGKGTVADYAAAAKASHVDFVVFLESFATENGSHTLSAAALAQLVSDCAAHSDDAVLLIPGYAIEHQFGNMMFVFGDLVELPPSDLLTSDGRRFKINEVDPATPHHNVTG